MGALVPVVIAAVIVIWMRKRKRRTTRQHTRKTLELTLAVVGFEASGKTVFTGSMFNELRVPDASGVFLDTSPENASKLLALYNTTADTDKKFPNSTNKGEMVEWPFTVKARSAAGVTEVGKLSDFPRSSISRVPPQRSLSGPPGDHPGGRARDLPVLAHGGSVHAQGL